MFTFKLKYQIAFYSIFCFYIYKFCHMQIFWIIIILLIDTNLKISIYYNIFSLDLLIFWEIKYSRKFLFHDQEKV